MMKISLESGNLDVLTTGTAFLKEPNSDLTFNLNFEEENFKIRIVLKFVSTDEKEYSIEREISGNTATLLCYNFDEKSGIGTSFPIDMATINDRKLYLHFWAYMIGKNETRKVEYTFYRKRR